MKRSKHPAKIGTFQIGKLSTIGHIALDGKKTKVRLSSNEFYSFGKREEERIHGVLTDHEKITLVGCVTSTVPGSTSTPNGRSFHASVFPHYIVTGDRHLEPEKESIHAIELSFENAHVLFWDYQAFGSSFSKDEAQRKMIEKLATVEGKTPEIDEYTHLFYFTGKSGIFSAQTSLGKISAAHCPSFTFPSPKGLRIKNRIPLRIEFDSPVRFEEAIYRIYAVKLFADLLLGSEQGVKALAVTLPEDGKDKKSLDVYHSMARPPTKRTSWERPHPGDVLINGGMTPDVFSAVLTSWFERQQDWRVARSRFFQNFRKQNNYSTDRLVAAANIFDLIPISAVGEQPGVTPLLSEATAQAKALFKALPQTAERDSVLSALGRVGERNLRSKVEHRAKLITAQVGERFPDLSLVISAAISTRNYFVHGTPGKLSPEDAHELSFFFTDTLEFIFAASDLVEAGWDIKNWISKGTTQSHPFGRYRVGYLESLANLKNKLGAN